MMHSIVVMPGDGIGRIVVPEAIRVLRAVGFQAHYRPAEIGWECWRRSGCALPEQTVAAMRAYGVGLLGAITSKPAEDAEAELAPELRGRGLRYVSAVLELRRRLRLTTAIRPCRTLRGNPFNFIRRHNGAIEEPIVDISVVMQNTECLYSGVEWSHLPRELRAALDTHPAMAAFGATDSQDLTLSCRLLSRQGCLDIARAAFELATERGEPVVTLCDKWGVMNETASLMLETATLEGRNYPGIELRRANVDSLLMWMMRSPERYRVILCSAFIGDIVSDAAAGLVGGLGFASCANLGTDCAVFEPIHGSAPHHALVEPARVNPIAAILAAAMLCDHVGEEHRGQTIRAAIEAVVSAGRVRTTDMIAGDQRDQAATTRQMTDAIINEAVKR